MRDVVEEAIGVQSLPDEVLTAIVRKVDLSTCAPVCRRWRRIALGLAVTLWPRASLPLQPPTAKKPKHDQEPAVDPLDPVVDPLDLGVDPLDPVAGDRSLEQLLPSLELATALRTVRLGHLASLHNLAALAALPHVRRVELGAVRGGNAAALGGLGTVTELHVNRFVPVSYTHLTLPTKA